MRNFALAALLVLGAATVSAQIFEDKFLGERPPSTRAVLRPPTATVDQSFYAPRPSSDRVLYYTATQSDKRNVVEPRDIGSTGFYDSLATMDGIQFTMSLFNEDKQPEYVGMVDSLRSRNPDMVVIDYLYMWGVEDDWVDADSVYTAGNIRHDWYTFIDEHDYFTRKIDGNRAAYLPELLSNSWMINIGYSETRADSIAQFFADYINASGNSKWYTGVYLDYFDYPSVMDWQCAYGDCRDSVDLDYDGIPYIDDTADEAAINRQGYTWFVTKLREKINHEKFIILANGSAHYADDVFAGLIEGGTLENIEALWPFSRAQWVSLMTDVPAAYSSTVMDRPMILFDHLGYSENREEDLVASSLISGGGWATITNLGGATRRFWSLEESTMGRLVLGQPIDGGVQTAVGDTLYHQYEMGYVKFVPDTTGTPGSGGYDSPQYVVVDTTSSATPDTLLASSGWPRADDIDAPAYPTGLIATAGDGLVGLSWTANTEDDLASYTVYRGLSTGKLDSLTTRTVANYFDTTVSNGTEYFYGITAVDDSGNESALSAIASATPVQPPLAFASFSLDSLTTGSVVANMTATTNRASFMRRLFWDAESSAPDTTDMSWENPAATNWGGAITTTVTEPTYAASDSSVRLTWDAGSGHDHYYLVYTVDRGYGTTDTSMVNGNIHADSTGYTWTSAPRGELDFNLYGSNADGDTLSSVALLDSLEYNQAVKVYAQFLAVADTSDYDTVTASDEDSAVLVASEAGESYSGPTGMIAFHNNYTGGTLTTDTGINPATADSTFTDGLYTAYINCADSTAVNVNTAPPFKMRGLPMDETEANQAGNTNVLFGFNFNDKLNGATIDSAKVFLQFWETSYLAFADSLKIVGITNPDYNGWSEEQDACWAYEDASETTAWVSHWSLATPSVLGASGFGYLASGITGSAYNEFDVTLQVRAILNEAAADASGVFALDVGTWSGGLWEDGSIRIPLHDAAPEYVPVLIVWVAE